MGNLNINSSNREYDDLFFHDIDHMPEKVTIASGEGELTRGTLLGKVTADGKYRLSVDTESDGSQVPEAILAEDVDATSADVDNVVIYLTGAFNVEKITFGGAHDQANTRDVLRDKNIFLRQPVTN